MIIFEQLKEQLGYLAAVLEGLREEEYRAPIAHLSESTVGQHSRHIIELIDCAYSGHTSGTVDYAARKRDLRLERDLGFALQRLKALLNMVNPSDKQLLLAVEGSPDILLPTTFYREVVYNTEHTIHHLALIKVALTSLGLELKNDHFGLAYATIRYREQSNEYMQASAS